MNKSAKRLFSLFLSAIMLCVICFPAKAKNTVTEPSNGRYYRIKYAGNNRYLDIPSEGYANNGTQLQVWNYVQGNQNQIFKLVKVNDSNKWRIVAQNGKIVEVRNSSHEDYAQVAQWDSHSLDCGLWTIRKNGDINGTVSFQNVESKKFLNVCGGGDAGNGTKIIQYHNDETIAMKFILEELSDSDIYSANYKRYIQDDEIWWLERPKGSGIINSSGFGKDGYYPAPGQMLLASASFISPNTVANLLKKHAYSTSTWNQIKAALRGELDATAMNKLLKTTLDISDDIPYIGLMISILQILVDSQSTSKWNKFVDAVEIYPNGQCSGVIVYNYYNTTITQDPNYASGMVYTYIGRRDVVSYKSWTGSNFADVKALPQQTKSGTWNYLYK